MLRLSGVSRARARDSLTLASQSSNLHRAAIKSRPRDGMRKRGSDRPPRGAAKGDERAAHGSVRDAHARADRVPARVLTRKHAAAFLAAHKRRHPGDGGSLRELVRRTLTRASFIPPVKGGGNSNSRDLALINADERARIY